MHAPDFVLFSQATSRVVFELAARLARELGPVVLHTGTEFGEARPGLTVVPAPRYDNSSYRSRMRTWLAYSASALAFSRQVSGSPVVLVSSNPPMAPMFAALLRRTRGWPFVAYVLDVYPDAFVANGLVSERHPLVQGWALAQRRAYAQADEVVTLAPCMGERVARYLPRGRAPLVIPSWVDADAIKPLGKEHNRFAAAHGLTSRLAVLYSGNLGLTHDVEGLLGAAHELARGARDDVRFVLIGGGGRHDEIAARTAHLSNFVTLPLQPEAELPFTMTAADVAVVTLGRGMGGVSMPSKTYYVMAAGCALLGIADGDNDVRRLIDEHQCGVCVDAGDARGVLAALTRFREDPAFLARCKANARAAVEREYGTEVVTARFLDLFRRLRARSAAR